MFIKYIKKNKKDILILSSLAMAIIAGLFLGNVRANQLEKSLQAKQPVDVPAVCQEIEPPAPVYVEPEKKYMEITVIATAYCPCSICCGKCDGITATGTKATAGRTIAADTSIYPYGTEIILNGNSYIVEDCGGAIKGANRVDIFFNTHEEALQFGRRILTAKVEI